MGYGEDTKGYKILLNGKISLCHDVRFNEELRGTDTTDSRAPAATRQNSGDATPRSGGPHPSDGVAEMNFGAEDGGGDTHRPATQTGTAGSTNAPPDAPNPNTLQGFTQHGCCANRQHETKNPRRTEGLMHTRCPRKGFRRGHACCRRGGGGATPLSQQRAHVPNLPHAHGPSQHSRWRWGGVRGSVGQPG